MGETINLAWKQQSMSSALAGLIQMPSTATTYSEQQIVEGCVRNERKFQEMLYREHVGAMMRMCMRHTHDEQKALDIVNQGFLRVFQKIELYRGEGSLQGWIRKIVYHSISKHFSGNKKYREHIILEDYDNSSPSKSDALDSLYYDDLVGLMDHLPPKTAEVFKAYAIDGLTHKEIADSHGITVGTSKWHCSEARSKLQAIIKKTHHSS